MDWFSFLIIGVPLLLLLIALAIWIVSFFPTKKRAIKVVRQFTLLKGGQEYSGPSFGFSKTKLDEFYQKQLGEKSNWHSTYRNKSILFRGAWNEGNKKVYCTLFTYWEPALPGTKPNSELIIALENGEQVEYPNLFGVVPSIDKIQMLYDQLLKSKD